MAQFHFVEDYENLVRQLLAQYPLDEAMSRAVGGDFMRVGAIAADILSFAGAKDGVDVLDFGCGSGRVAVALARRMALKTYLGIDIVADLLRYAQSMCPPHFSFKLNRQYNIPAADQSFDLACAFSVFTHLLQAETFIYMRDIGRTLRPRGKFVFSFLEMADEEQWPIFAATVEAQLNNTLPHLNEFTDRKQIKVLARHSGFKVLEFFSGSERRWNGQALGQSIAILQKA